MTAKFTDAKKQRFPTFWGANFDWTSDFNHAESEMSAIQEMLLQTNGNSIYMAPAWPKGWIVDFKLHTLQQILVQGKIGNEILQNESVVPANRAKDVSFRPPATQSKSINQLPSTSRIIDLSWRRCEQSLLTIY